jgi:predicted metal-dependent hydrolase
MSIRPDRKILVSFPPVVSFTRAYEFIVKNKSWIEKQQEKFQIRLVSSMPLYPVKTRYHTVNLLPGNDSFSVRQQKYDITIHYPASMPPDNEQVQKYASQIMTAVYRWEAKRYLPARLIELSLKHNLPFNKVTIRNNRSNWGSCSSKNNISLNLNLMKIPDHLIDFILLHELVHTRIKNHGIKFWELLNTLTNGQAKMLTSEVKKYSPH